MPSDWGGDGLDGNAARARKVGVFPCRSVFFCRLAAVDLVRLKSRLYDEIDLDRDRT
jgi:hypothetical protein